MHRTHMRPSTARARRTPRALLLPVLFATAALANVASPAVGRAQDSTAGVARPAEVPSKFCFRGRALPRCTSFLLVEAGYYRHLVGSEFRGIDTNEVTREATDARDRDSHFSWELGYMRNVDARNALGGTLLVGTGTAGARVGVKGRYRRWVGAEGTGRLDFGAGVLRGGMQDRVANPNRSLPEEPLTIIAAVPAYGVTADVTYDIGDLFGVSTRVELTRAEGGRTGTAVFGGVRLGSYSAVVASAAAGAGLVWLIWALAQGDG